ncbi:MAG: thiamine phosphate synthase [Phycisphaerales bacterium]|nr:thiamine phosphate synthase [Phycisphaerales bacterium]
MSCEARILDANLNRAREAMRVMEDVARLAFDDGPLCADVKAMRHELRGAVAHLPQGWLEANRDSAGDVGADIASSTEMSRSGLLDVAISAGKRLTEALRVVEEVLKTNSVEAAAKVKFIRYRAYDIDSRLQARFGTGRARQWKLCVLLTQSLCKRPWMDVARAVINGGADCIQVREKEMDGGALARHVEEIIALARPAGASVIVNDRVDVAMAVRADGVHVGGSDLAVRDIRRIAGRSLLVGVSTHDLGEANQAVEAGADYCGVGAMFASSLKPDRIPSGPAYLRAFIERFPGTPHLAIGGVTPQNIHELAAAGARGVAVSAAICAAPDPESVTRQIRAAIDQSSAPQGAAPLNRSQTDPQMTQMPQIELTNTTWIGDSESVPSVKSADA